MGGFLHPSVPIHIQINMISSRIILYNTGSSLQIYFLKIAPFNNISNNSSSFRQTAHISGPNLLYWPQILFLLPATVSQALLFFMSLTQTCTKRSLLCRLGPRKFAKISNVSAGCLLSDDVYKRFSRSLWDGCTGGQSGRQESVERSKSRLVRPH